MGGFWNKEEEIYSWEDHGMVLEAVNKHSILIQFLDVYRLYFIRFLEPSMRQS